jgi:hypothetical protein
VEDWRAKQHHAVQNDCCDIGEAESEEADANVEIVMLPGTDGLGIRWDEQASDYIEYRAWRERHQEPGIVPLNFTIRPEGPPTQAEPVEAAEDPSCVDPVPSIWVQHRRETTQETHRSEGADQRHRNCHILEQCHFTFSAA